MGLVTATEVKAILDNSQLLDATVDSFIIGADALVISALGSSSLSAALIKEIERYLTAHLISITVERMASKEGAGGANITYTGMFGQGLEASAYGQMVKVLDTTGRMALLAGKSAKIYAVKGYIR